MSFPKIRGAWATLRASEIPFLLTRRFYISNNMPAVKNSARGRLEGFQKKEWKEDKTKKNAPRRQRGFRRRPAWCCSPARRGRPRRGGQQPSGARRQRRGGPRGRSGRRGRRPFWSGEVAGGRLEKVEGDGRRWKAVKAKEKKLWDGVAACFFFVFFFFFAPGFFLLRASLLSPTCDDLNEKLKCKKKKGIHHTGGPLSCPLSVSLCLSQAAALSK